jgi:hypothetical protein
LRWSGGSEGAMRGSEGHTEGGGQLSTDGMGGTRPGKLHARAGVGMERERGGDERRRGTHPGLLHARAGEASVVGAAGGD